MYTLGSKESFFDFKRKEKEKMNYDEIREYQEYESEKPIKKTKKQIKEEAKKLDRLWKQAEREY